MEVSIVTEGFATVVVVVVVVVEALPPVRFASFAVVILKLSKYAVFADFALFLEYSARIRRPAVPFAHLPPSFSEEPIV